MRPARIARRMLLLAATMLSVFGAEPVLSAAVEAPVSAPAASCKPGQRLIRAIMPGC